MSGRTSQQCDHAVQDDTYIDYSSSPLLGLFFEELQEVCSGQDIQVNGYLIKQQHLVLGHTRWLNIPACIETNGHANHNFKTFLRLQL